MKKYEILDNSGTIHTIKAAQYEYCGEYLDLTDDKSVKIASFRKSSYIKEMPND